MRGKYFLAFLISCQFRDAAYITLRLLVVVFIFLLLCFSLSPQSDSVRLAFCPAPVLGCRDLVPSALARWRVSNAAHAARAPGKSAFLKQGDRPEEQGFRASAVG